MQRPITKMVVGGMSDKTNPPTPADCRPLSTRTTNNGVTEMTKPALESSSITK